MALRSTDTKETALVSRIRCTARVGHQLRAIHWCLDTVLQVAHEGRRYCVQRRACSPALREVAWGGAAQDEGEQHSRSTQHSEGVAAK